MSTSGQAADAAVRTVGLSKNFGPVAALTSLDLVISRGEVLGCLGPNGAGKTTMIRLLLGLIRPSSGRAEIFGTDAQDAAVAHRRLAYVPGESSLWPSLTGAQTLQLLANLHGSVDRVYQRELIEMFDLDVARRVRTYSKGNRQKVALIAALSTRAELLLLDEPTSGLDPLMEQTFRQCVALARERGQTVLLSSHILSEVEALCDRVAILRSGHLADLGTLDELRHLAAVEVSIVFAAEVPDLGPLPGVSGVQVHAGTLTLQLRGPIDPLLKAIAGYRVNQLLSRKPSLEELFLAHYGAAEPIGHGQNAG
jgi:ABC-2 type transport system ATP-binding protein